MSEASKGAYDRFRFKHRVCYKKCMLYVDKGGFCEAPRLAIDACMEENAKLEDARDYRNLNTALDWLEIFLGESGIVGFQPNKELITRIELLILNTKKDCYSIAEELTKEIINGSRK